MAGVGVIGRVSLPISGESGPLDVSATDCDNGVQMPEGVRRPVAGNEGGDSSRLRPEHAGDVSMAPCNHHRPARSSFALPCEFCQRPVKIDAERYIELFDAGKFPTCGACRPYLPYLKELRK